MGNEMGNRNVSGLQEEEKSAVEAPEKSLQEAVNEADVKGENHIIPEDKDKDFHAKVEGLSSFDDPSGAIDSPVGKQTPEQKDQDDPELKLPQCLDSPTESNDADSEGNVIQSASLPEEASDHENLREPNLEGDMLVTSDHLIKEPLSVERDEVEISNSTCDAKSASHDVDQESDEHELVEVHAETLVGDCDASPMSSEEIIGSGLSCHDEEKVYLIDTKTAQKTEVFADGTELKPQSVDAPKESNDAASEDSGIQFASSFEEASAYETLIEPNLEGSLGTSDDQIQKQLSFRRETVPEEVSNSTFDSKSALHDEDPNSDEDELVDVHVETLVEDSDATPRDSEELIGPNISREGKETGHLIAKETAENTAAISVSDDNGQDLEKKLFMNDGASQEEMLLNMNICEEKCEILSLDEAGNGLQKITSPIIEEDSSKSESSSAPFQAVLQAGSVEVFKETSDPQDKSIVLPEQTKLIGSGSENEETCCDQFSNQPVNELKFGLSNVSQSEMMKIGFDGKQNEKETEIDVSSSNIENIYVIEEAKVENNGTQVFVEEVIEKVAELGIVSPELTVTDHNHEEDKVTEDVEEKQEDPYAIGNESNKRETTENCIFQSNSAKQIQGPLSQSPHAPPPPPPPFISQYTIVDMSMGSEDDENKDKLIKDSKQHNCGENVQRVSVVVAETETPTNPFDEQCTKGEIPASAISGFEGQESVCIELRKSPSFDFDLSNEARSQESDPTPLLLHEKTSVRSLSTRDDVRFQIQNSTVQDDYGQGALRYEPVSVEEKTIRVERSDSNKSRAPFKNVLKKEENANFAVITQRPESQVSVRKEPNDEVVLKRKPKSYYLFSTCICCAAAIN